MDTILKTKKERKKEENLISDLICSQKMGAPRDVEGAAGLLVFLGVGLEGLEGAAELFAFENFQEALLILLVLRHNVGEANLAVKEAAVRRVEHFLLNRHPRVVEPLGSNALCDFRRLYACVLKRDERG
jgi:hypothetical protein